MNPYKEFEGVGTFRTQVFGERVAFRKVFPNFEMADRASKDFLEEISGIDLQVVVGYNSLGCNHLFLSYRREDGVLSHRESTVFMPPCKIRTIYIHPA